MKKGILIAFAFGLMGAAVVMVYSMTTWQHVGVLDALAESGMRLCGNQPVRRVRVDGVELDATISTQVCAPLP